MVLLYVARRHPFNEEGFGSETQGSAADEKGYPEVHFEDLWDIEEESGSWGRVYDGKETRYQGETAIPSIEGKENECDGKVAGRRTQKEKRRRTFQRYQGGEAPKEGEDGKVQEDMQEVNSGL